MSIPRFVPSILVVAVAACLGLLSAAPLLAKTVKFPKEDPKISFEVPDDWGVREGNNLLLYPEKGNSYYVLLVFMGTSKTDREALKQAMVDVGRETLGFMERSRQENFHESRETGHGWPAMHTLLSGYRKEDGVRMASFWIGFVAPKAGQVFVNLATKAEDLPAHIQSLQDVVNSCQVLP